MDQFFAGFFLLHEFAMMGIGLLLIIVGGVACAYLLEVRGIYRRVSYLWFYSVANLVLMGCQFGWLFVSFSATAGFLSVLIIGIFSSFFFFGAAAYYAAARRSNHINGTTDEAWFAFIPILNLFLFFRRGKVVSDLDVEKRSSFSRFVGDPLLVIGAILVFGIGQSLEKAFEETLPYQVDDGIALRALITKAQTLEESFAAEALASSEILPYKVDDNTVWSAIDATGNTLRMTYDVDVGEGNSVEFDSEILLKVAKNQCASDMFGYDISRGGRIVFVYRGPDKQILKKFEVTQADCAG